MSIAQLRKRLDALSPHDGLGPWCLVFSEDGEDQEYAIRRHVDAGECKPDSGGHFVVAFVDSARP